MQVEALFLICHYLSLSFRTTYSKVAGKYQDVLTLESSVAELHQMFLDFALLTEQQGELLDQIEFQVKQAGDYIEDANVDVYESIQYQKSIRKKQWYVNIEPLLLLLHYACIPLALSSCWLTINHFLLTSVGLWPLSLYVSLFFCSPRVLFLRKKPGQHYHWLLL
jgi:hypothetical protein